MKKILKKLWGLVKRHKLLTLICTLSLILIVIMAIVFVKFFVGGNDKYGDRLEGIKEVEIKNKDKDAIMDFIEEHEEVSTTSVRVQGKIIYINIKFNEGTSLDRAKEIANGSVGKIEEEKREYYDLGYFLTTEGENSFYITGTKNPKSENISWIKS